MKSELRARIRNERSEMDRLKRQAWTAELNQQLLATPALSQARCVGGFLAFDGEPDIRFTLTQLARRGVTVALPVLPDDSAHGLTFHRWTPATPLRANRHGISEPKGTSIVDLASIDTLLVPLVAWDREGGRLGMGGGWYDRTLAASPMTATRVGVAWSLQEVPSVPRDPWDQPLNAVVTERGWFTCHETNATIARPDNAGSMT